MEEVAGKGRGPGTCWGVGVGPGDPELVTLKALRVLEACEVVAAPQTGAGASVALDIVRAVVDLSGKEVLALPFAMARDGAACARRHGEAADAVAERLAAGRDVAFACLGDVGVFSTFSYVADVLRGRGFSVEAVPGVTSFSAVAARLGEGLTERDEPLHVVPAGAWAGRIDEVLDLPGTKVLMKPGGRVGELVGALDRRGELDRAALVADCGLAGEAVCRDLASWDARAHGSYFTTIVVKG